jgi:sortase (surface protein transpeptidase)
LARLTISDLRLSLIVVEGVSRKDLIVAPGHIPGTSLPGHAGTCYPFDFVGPAPRRFIVRTERVVTEVPSPAFFEH